MVAQINVIAMQCIFCKWRDAPVICTVQDTVIYERLVGHQPFKDETTQHLQDFAALGLTHYLPDVVVVVFNKCVQYIGWSLAVKESALTVKIQQAFRCSPRQSVEAPSGERLRGKARYGVYCR